MSERTIAVTGSASGMGAATQARLESAGDRVIGVDLAGAEVTADLGSASGRAQAAHEIAERSGGSLDGLVTFAGLPGLSTTAGSMLASVNYFGTVGLLEALRQLLAGADRPAAVAIGSNSATCQPGVPLEVVERCLDGDEEGARTAADRAGAIATYPATKLAIARWVRRHAPTGEWAGNGITLNVLAPGAVTTPLLQSTRDDPVIGRYIDAFPIPVGRPGAPDELAAAVQFLLGPDARFFCGAVLVADGGTDALLRADDFPAPMEAS